MSEPLVIAPPFAHISGPKSGAKLAIVGEAWGEQEALTGMPFMGSSGTELNRMLTEAGLTRKEIFCTNVFALRPPNNNLDLICGKKAEVGANYPMPPLKQGKYILPQYLPEVLRLRQELEAVRPNLCLALGNTACWALLGSARISAIRGAVSMSTLVPGLKILPTYHPAAVLRNWALRTIVVADLMKSKREQEFPDIRRPERYVLVHPTLSEMTQWRDELFAESTHWDSPLGPLAVDIETAGGQITCIGFAKSRSNAIVVPFVDRTRPGASYWQDIKDEVAAWNWVKELLESEHPKIFQNGLYDLQYIARMGIRPKNCLHDTMLLHHSLYPEMQKGLGFLGSIYTDESSWKLMRNQETEKRDE